MLTRLREPGVLVVPCDMDEKLALMEAEPAVYFQTDHYAGYPAVLVRLHQIDPLDLEDILERAWRQMATARMIAELDQREATE